MLPRAKFFFQITRGIRTGDSYRLKSDNGRCQRTVKKVDRFARKVQIPLEYDFKYLGRPIDVTGIILRFYNDWFS